MDLDAVTDELYGLPPGEFTAAREERAKAARAAGEGELATRIRRLRRPTLAAWAGNLLVRELPDEAERLLRLGEALRQAHRDLDGEQLRELSARQHQLTQALSGQAAELTDRAGQRISDDVRQEVQDTLLAVLADPEAAEQWAKGRLTKPLTAPVGFPVGARRARPAEVADLDAARVKRRQRQERASQEAAEAERDLHAREDELAAAEEEQRRTEEARRQAEQHVTDLSRQLRDAEREQRRAQGAVRKAQDDTRAAERAVHQARRRTEEATARARKLTER
ncbi:hypothetical protein [Streptomyces sp. NPDC057877]|uniref:hypothetical protein n=1 Tax=Streptomyces sp. NPDC057877 TaxID=3346269 RepID=UPI0036C9D3F0